MIIKKKTHNLFRWDENGVSNLTIYVDSKI